MKGSGPINYIPMTDIISGKVEPFWPCCPKKWPCPQHQEAVAEDRFTKEAIYHEHRKARSTQG